MVAQTTTRRRIKSVKFELIKKSREAMLSAVQIYNNPQVTFKSETYITLSVIAWTYLMHAYYRDIGVDYRYYKYEGRRKRYSRTKKGAYKHWELERCLDEKECPLDSDTKNNLKFLIGIRHEIEHQMTNHIDEFLSAKLQACAINYDFYLCKLFGKGYVYFSINTHINLWKSKNAKDPALGYGVEVSKQWYWYDKWLYEVEEYCKEHEYHASD